MSDFRLFAACAPGLEELLRQETAELGAQEPIAVPGGVEMRGDPIFVYRANLELGLASHVVLRAGSFPCKHPAELARKASRIEWTRWLAADVPVQVVASSKRSKLYHTGAVAERVRRAIETHFGRTLVAASDDDSGIRVHVRVVDDEVTISIDTSGEPLHRRGYRQQTAKAPLREDLAQALLRVAGWDGESMLVDPMMGAGTIVIEAAMRAVALPPGYARRFAFMRMPFFDPQSWQRLYDERLGRVRATLPFPIHGSDREAGALSAATANAQRAGVEGVLTLAQAPLGRAPGLAQPSTRGALVTNPPRGDRVGDRQRLRPLYRALGRAAQALPPDWRVGIAASNRRLALRSGLPLRTSVLTDHGGTKLRLMRADGN